MNQGNNISNGFTTAPLAKTISDLKEDYFDGFVLSEEQKMALKNFDKLRVSVLSEADNDEDFQLKYFELQMKENTEDYHNFI